MAIDDITTVSQRYPTKDKRVTKVIIGNKGPNGIIIAKRIYYEVNDKGRKLIAMDWISALATLYDLDAPPELIDE
jgi:hypothetical protein